MGLAIPSGPGLASPPITGKMFSMRVIGTEQLRVKLTLMHTRMKRTRSVGIDRVGKYLLSKKKEDCKAGLYSGKEVAPNKWRYGWEYLGGPAIYEFTGSVLKAHELGKRVNADIDTIDVFINPAVSPHAALIHGYIHSTAGAFTSPMMKRLVKTRPWMKATEDEKNTAMAILIKTYLGG